DVYKRQCPDCLKKVARNFFDENEVDYVIRLIDEKPKYWERRYVLILINKQMENAYPNDYWLGKLLQDFFGRRGITTYNDPGFNSELAGLNILQALESAAYECQKHDSPKRNTPPDELFK
ncbi:MAG: glutaredoxin, partial [Deltaproteobacteria bacterium]|nr:glutaredoxin [Deltaproteobacteria bacterium]